MALPYATEDQLKQLKTQLANVGNKSVKTKEELDALKGKDGQLVYCQADSKLYIFKKDRWEEVGSDSAGGSGGDPFDVVTISEDMSTYTGTITGTKAVIIKFGEQEFIPTNIYVENGIISCSVTQGTMELTFEFDNGNVTITPNDIGPELLWNHFLTITSYKDGTADGYAYFNFYDTSEQEINNVSSLFTRIENKYVMGSGYLHGKYIVYMSTMDSNIIATYLESGAVQSTITIDSTFGIFDRVSRVN